MGWQTKRLVDAMPDAYDFYFDEMSQIKVPSWSSGRIALLGEAAFGPSPMSGRLSAFRQVIWPQGQHEFWPHPV